MFVVYIQSGFVFILARPPPLFKKEQFGDSLHRTKIGNPQIIALWGWHSAPESSGTFVYNSHFSNPKIDEPIMWRDNACT